ncbi:MAG: DUF350 domain-containing protein [Myxococcales bacterium]|nr:DUF350 domain-containing protein [Myxococcales bacterium]
MLESPAYPIVFTAVLATVLVLALQLTLRVTSKDDHLKEALAKGNVARGLLHVGDVLSVFLVAASAVGSCVHAEDLKSDALWSLVFGVAATVVYGLVSRLGMRSLFKGKLVAELDRGNEAAGVAAASHAIATGVITAKALGGDDLPSLGLSAVFFVLAQATLHLYVALFRALTSYDDAEEILGENLAAALSYAGVTIALGLIIGRAVEGSFTGWASSLQAYGVALLYGLGLYVVRQIVVQTVILGAGFSLRKGKLDQAIGRERNVAMGALEAIAYVATALALMRVG